MKEYIKPEIKISTFSTEDVVTISAPDPSGRYVKDVLREDHHVLDSTIITVND